MGGEMENKAHAEDFRHFLQQDLVQRCRKNPKYSLRAYARFLQIEPSALSRILRGRRALTPQMFSRLADRCGLAPKARESFRRGHFDPASVRDYHELTEDRFQVISVWHTWALLELMRTEGFTGNPRTVARQLGVSVAEVHDSFDRLERIGLIKKSGKTYELLESEITTVGIPGSGSALRGLQKQYLEKAIHALENVPIEHRDQSTITLACDARHMPILKEKLKRLRREMSEIMEQSKRKTSVYALTLSLFPLTRDFEGEVK